MGPEPRRRRGDRRNCWQSSGRESYTQDPLRLSQPVIAVEAKDGLTVLSCIYAVSAGRRLSSAPPHRLNWMRQS